MSITDDPILEPVEPPESPTSNGNAAPDGPGWRQDRQGRDYVARPKGGGKPGVIYRQGDETPAQALERDGKPKEPRPRRKAKAPKKPDAPKDIDLKAVELALAEALKQPAIFAAMAGDEWAADHFTTAGPYLARNLVVAADHNPWLRRKLEEAAMGQDAMMKLVALVPLGGAIVLYTVPPIIYWFNLPVKDATRKRFGIPPRKEREPEYASPETPSSPEPLRFGPPGA